MTQVDFTLNDEEVLQVLTGNRDDAFKFLLERIINQIMKAESEDQLGAGMNERTCGRTDYRNGTRERELNTRIGKLVLEVPRHRNAPFHTMIFENYTRSEASLIATMVQMVIAGVSTRKVEKVVETLCGTSFSKSTVSQLCKRLDKEIDVFLHRSLEYISAPFLMVDATYFRARENHVPVSKAFLVALAIKSDGTREVVGFAVHDAENNYAWNSFFGDLKERGLSDVRMVISDAHKSIRKAIVDTYPQAAWQRCQVHLTRDILDEINPKYVPGIKIELRDMFTSRTVDEARKKMNEIVEEYEDVAPKAMETLTTGFEDSMTARCFPDDIYVKLRTSNMIERLNRELKRRSDVIQIFPDPQSVLRLMGAVTMEFNDTQTAKSRMFTDYRFEEMFVKAAPELKKVSAAQRAAALAS